MAKEIIVKCDFCRDSILNCESMTYAEFMAWVSRGRFEDTQRSIIKKDIDLCNTCKRKINAVISFIEAIQEN